MRFLRRELLLSLLLGLPYTNATQDTDGFTIVNGQLYTPGLIVIDSPQPNTPEGGSQLSLSHDVNQIADFYRRPPSCYRHLRKWPTPAKQPIIISNSHTQYNPLPLLI